jgi:hypothetical protein
LSAVTEESTIVTNVVFAVSFVVFKFVNLWHSGLMSINYRIKSLRIFGDNGFTC